MKTLQDFILFSKGLEKHILKTFSPLLESSAAEEQDVIAKSLDSSSSRKARLLEPNLEIRLIYPKIFSERVWIKYCILSWFVGPYTQFELQEVLRKKGDQLKVQNYESYLESKDLCFFSLFLELNVKHSDLFGNILQPGVTENARDSEGKKIRLNKKDVLKLTLRSQPKAKKKVFRRGYNDHGSLPAADERARREANEFKGSQEQWNLELEKQNWKFAVHLNLLATQKLLEEVRRGIS